MSFPSFPLRGNGLPAVVAHRGASSDAPENTLPAFEWAWGIGARWIETDVQPTADGVPVLLHDDDLDRTTTGSGPVRSHSWVQLAGMDAGEWFAGGEFARTPIPRLADLLATVVPGRSLLLEIKGHHTADEIAAELSAISRAGCDDRVVVQSFEVEALLLVQALSPGRPTGLLVEQLHDDPIAVCVDLGASSYNPDFELLQFRPELISRLHEAGLAVCVWTADSPADWAWLTEIGVDGIITNRPAELLAWQSSR